jgi:hypothetical protein
MKPGLKPGFGLKIDVDWTKNKPIRTKNRTAVGLKIAWIRALWTKNSWEGAAIALKINH